jgi:hypothetical protein
VAKDDAPFGLDRRRHLALSGRAHHVWQRRVGLVVVAVLPILASVDVFGQGPTYSTAQTPVASMRIDSPSHVRGGLIFTSEFTITPRAPIHDMRLLLADGWFQGMTFNGITPQPSSESAQGKWEVYDFGSVPAGTAYPIWVSWQTNPTNVGRHTQDVALDNGGTQLMVVHRTISVFP